MPNLTRTARVAFERMVNANMPGDPNAKPTRDAQLIALDHAVADLFEMGCDPATVRALNMNYHDTYEM